jgi:hypothetical protein
MNPSHSTPATDICYLTLPVDSTDQAVSLAEYLTRHGITAAHELNEVTCPLEDPAAAADIHQLKQNWALYWRHSDAEIFGLPIFHKPACGAAQCTGVEQ